MPNKPIGNSNDKKSGRGAGIIIIIILILIFFLWRFIDYADVNWTGNIKNQTVNSMPYNNNINIPLSDNPVRPNYNGEGNTYQQTTTAYNYEHLRWAGRLGPGEYAVWGEGSLDQTEKPVSGVISPIQPRRVYGNIREWNGTGIKFMIFGKEEYNSWTQGNKQAKPIIDSGNVSEYNYSFGVGDREYFIVALNESTTNTAHIGFTGVDVYQRTLDIGENRNNSTSFVECYYICKKEKLTAFEYILKLVSPSQVVSVTPPYIGR